MMDVSLRHDARALAILAALVLSTACSTSRPAAEPRYSSQQHYEDACESASRDIDTLMVHWEDIRSNDRIPAMQVTQARQAISVIAPVCNNIAAVSTLDSTRLARVQSAFRTIELLARNLPRFPAGG